MSKDEFFELEFGKEPGPEWDYEDWVHWKQLKKAFNYGVNYAKNK